MLFTVGFNEAPAFLPGNSDQAFQPIRPVGGASMRPRHFYRGIGARGYHDFDPFIRGFNEAPAFLPGNRAKLDVEPESIRQLQ